MKWSIWHSVSPLRFWVDISHLVTAEQDFVDLRGEVVVWNTEMTAVLLKSEATRGLSLW